MSKPITQRQARENRKELNHLRDVMDSQRKGWVRDWPCSTVIGRLGVDAVTASLASIGKRFGGISRQRVSAILGDVKLRRVFVEEK